MTIERQLSVSPPSFPKLAMVENIALMELLFSFSKPCNLWFRLQIQLCRLASWHSYRILIRGRKGRWNGWRRSRRLIEFSLHKNGCGGRNNYGNNSNFSSSPSPYTFIYSWFAKHSEMQKRSWRASEMSLFSASQIAIMLFSEWDRHDSSKIAAKGTKTILTTPPLFSAFSHAEKRS